MQGKFCSFCIETTKILYHEDLLYIIGMNVINTNNLIVGLRKGWTII